MRMKLHELNFRSRYRQVQMSEPRPHAPHPNEYLTCVCFHGMRSHMLVMGRLSCKQCVCANFRDISE
jgi:hypothetical protein